MNPRELVAIRRDQASIIAALHGDFDKEIKLLDGLIKDWDKRNSLAKERTLLEEQKKLHAVNVDALAKEVSEHEDRLNKYSDQLDARSAELNKGEEDLKQKERKFAEGVSLFESGALVHKTNISSMNAALQSKLEAAQEQLDNLDKREALVAERENKVKAAMKQVGALVG